MSRNKKTPKTRALRMLEEAAVSFDEHPYKYEEKGGAPAAAAKLGVDVHHVVKTLIMEDEAGKPLVVLMHGDRSVSTKELARQLGRKRITPCAPEVAQHHSGYQIGGTSPFGLRRPLPVYVERSILAIPHICINGGRRGLLVGLASSELTRVLDAQPVDVAIPLE